MALGGYCQTGQANGEPRRKGKGAGNKTGQANKEPRHSTGPDTGRPIGDANHPHS